MNKDAKTPPKETEIDRSKVKESFRLAIAKKTGLKRKPFRWTKKSGKIIRLDLRNPTRH